ncbi:hypothetical protein [Thioalkalivibrio sp. ALE11]|uniref:hypothetical protein n=1 Tax=Thioalkalivibrio sp. ALE11 TaxID=1265494 RepID=UPI00037BF2D5|nr:hypothetical protein [Thioalkalivibrio sp. ALE11]
MRSRNLFGVSLVVWGLVLPTQALAGGSVGTITFTEMPGSGAQAVPSLGGAMLVILSVLLAFVALRVLHRRSGGHASPMLVAGLLGGALVTGGGGGKLISDAHSLTNPEPKPSFKIDENRVSEAVLDSPEGSYSFLLGAIVDGDGSLFQYENDLQVPVRAELDLDEMSCDLVDLQPDHPAPCEDGKILESGEKCLASLFCGDGGVDDSPRPSRL